MKVTPDNEAPIIPYATTYHGDFLFPIKNDWLSAFLEVIQVMVNKRIVYARNNTRIRVGDIETKIDFARLAKRKEVKKLSDYLI
jgi:hypothetical protein